MSRAKDLIFGIDMGMSCTGVAYVNQTTGSKAVRIFKEWKYRHREDKVPTQLLYEDGNPKPVAWGYGCDPEVTNPQGKNLVQCFKLGLGDTGNQEEHKKTERYFKDFLECIYQNLRDHFLPSKLDQKYWDEASIEFNFSVPSTWDTPTNRLFTRLAIEAGFGSKEGFQVFARLSEPLAAAAYAIKEENILKKNDRVLIIDAGGGTVDLSFLQIDDADRLTARTTEIGLVRGSEHGSTYIDDGLAKMAEQSLAKLENEGQLIDSVDRTIARMRRSFQSQKECFEDGHYGDDAFFRILIPGIRDRIDDPSINVFEGELEFKQLELRKLFDEQIKGINRMITGMMDEFRSSRDTRNEKVTRIFLSGGLSKSVYVQEKIQAHLDTHDHRPLINARLQLCGDPQLCICLGLLAHAERNVFRHRQARESLGVVFRMPMKVAEKHKKFKEAAKLARTPDKAHHITTDENKVEWMNNCIEWFVLVGEQVTEGQPIEKPYSATIDPNTDPATRIFTFDIVGSGERKPPSFRDSPHVHSLNTVEVNLSAVRLTPEKTRLFSWRKGQKGGQAKANYLIQAEISPVDVIFHCVDPDSKKQISGSLAIPAEHDECFDRPREGYQPERRNSSGH